MGSCRYCGQSAGFLKKQHKICFDKNHHALKTLPALFQKAFVSPIDPKKFREGFDRAVAAAWISNAQRKQIISKGLSLQADAALEDHVLTADEETRILEFCRALDVEDSDLGVKSRLVKAAILRDLDDGLVQSRISVDGALPIILSKDEKLIWAFADTDLWELKTRTSYVGGSSGVSVRLAKGLYYRAGAYKGERIQTTNLENSDSGYFCMTNKHIFFSGSRKTLRIQLKKLISAKVFEDGIELTKDGANPKPLLFSVDDPAFAANLISRLA